MRNRPSLPGYPAGPPGSFVLLAFRRLTRLCARHFLRHVQYQLAISFFRLSQHAAKLAQIACILPRTTPSDVIGRLPLREIRQFGRLLAVIEELVHGNFHRAGQLFQCFYGRDRVSIFDPRNVAPKKASPLFNISLREHLLFAYVTQSISNNHGDFASSGSVSRIDSTCESNKASPNILPARASHILVLEIRYQCSSALLSRIAMDKKGVPNLLDPVSMDSLTNLDRKRFRPDA